MSDMQAGKTAGPLGQTARKSRPDARSGLAGVRPRAAALRARVDEAADDRDQLLRVDRLLHEHVEARVHRAGPVLHPHVGGQRDRRGPPAALALRASAGCG